MPVFKQLLPTNVGPEGGKAIPSRNLYVVASEKDARDDKIRSTVTIYEMTDEEARYPTLMSERDPSTGVAIPWAAMSGLSPDPMDPETLYAVEDSFYDASRFFTIDTTSHPAILTKATNINDANDVFASMEVYGEFSAEDLAEMINSDKTVNIDSEGIAADGKGSFYIAHEGRGTVGDAGRPVESLNMIFKVDMDGVIEKVITLPDDLNDKQLRFGFEGIAYLGADEFAYIVVCIQRAWGDDRNPIIGIYDLVEDEWFGFVYYPLDERESQYGGWVGLSDITFVEDTFLVLERDNQGGPDAVVKRVYSINLFDIIPTLVDYPTVTKTLVVDLMPILEKTGGLPLEKLEGLAYTNGGIWIMNDNDGVDDNSGETQLLFISDYELGYYE